jgi:hypothetical protein
MVAKIRNIAKQFQSTHQTRFKNLLVSGCSYTWNNSEQHVCSWPYYLRDISGFDQVIDCSQSGAGSNHIFNSVVNEIETNPDINKHNTLVVVMWSGLTRTDVIAAQDITKPWHNMSNYNFDQKFATLSIFNHVVKNDPLSVLCQQYKRIIDTDAQIYESILKILALDCYLKEKGFYFVFTSWMDPSPELDRIDSPMTSKVFGLLSSLIPYLNEYAEQNNQKESCGHPTPDGYLSWTRQCLVPYLRSQNIMEPV